MEMKSFKECNLAVSNTRRPLVLIRGKPLSEEDLINLFITEEPFLMGWGENGEDLSGEVWEYIEESGEWEPWSIDREKCGTLKDILHRKGSTWLDGWAYTDGTIYGSFFEFKYPDYEECIDDWRRMAGRNPNVDMIVSYTSSNECICSYCKAIDDSWNAWGCDGDCLMKRQEKLRKYVENCNNAYWNRLPIYGITGTEDEHYLKHFFCSMKYWLLPFDVYKIVELTLHIHDGVVDTYYGELAQKKYIEYDRLYGDFRLELANESYFFNTNENSTGTVAHVQVDDNFMIKCFEKIGLPASKWLDEIKPQYMHNNSDGIVITKKWFQDQYDKYFNNTPLDINIIRAMQEDCYKKNKI